MKRVLLLGLALALLLSAYFLRGCVHGRTTATLFKEYTDAFASEKAPVLAVDYDMAAQALVIECDILTFEGSGFGIEENDLYYRLEYELFFPVAGEFAEGEVKVNSWYIDGFTVASADGGLMLTISERRLTAFEISERKGKIYIKPVHPGEKYDKILLLDPGHGGHDEGAVSQVGIVEWGGTDRLIEKDYNLALARKLELLLEDNPEIKVYLTRVDDVFISLKDRRELRDYMADIFVSLHVNASEFPAKNGLWTYYGSNTEPLDYSSDMFALDMLYSVAETTGYTGYDIDFANFAVLRDAKIPAALVEVGFLTNTRDLNNLVKEAFMDKLAIGVYNGIIEGFKRID